MVSLQLRDYFDEEAGDLPSEGWREATLIITFAPHDDLKQTSRVALQGIDMAPDYPAISAAFEKWKARNKVLILDLDLEESEELAPPRAKFGAGLWLN
jgi:hypothetical protein